MLNLPSGKTPTSKIRSVHGLLTLSSSSKKKNLSKCLKSAASNKHVSVTIDLDYGLVKRDSFAKFAINAFQYLLYDNEVIPIPFQYFERIYSATLSEPSALKKNALANMFANLSAVFEFMSQLFQESSIEPTHVAMCLGDSIRFAKQIFTFNITDLNLCSKLADKSSKVPLLTLNYLINTFYKKLLNEADDSGSVKGGVFQGKNKSSSVIFTVKINSQDIDKFEQLANEKGNDTPIVANRFQYMYRLGCTITKSTLFALSHRSSQGDFGIFTDADDSHYDGDLEEIIEEQLLEEDEENLKRSALAHLDNDQCLNESASSENGEEQRNASTDASLEKKSTDYIWVQIGAPIKCICKM